MATGMAATAIATTDVVVVAMVGAETTMAKAMVLPRSLCRNLMNNQWPGPAPTGAANAQVAVMAKDVAAINRRLVLRRKMLRLSSNNSNSQRRASSNPRAHKPNGKLHGHAAMALAIAKHQPALKISPPFSGA